MSSISSSGSIKTWNLDVTKVMEYLIEWQPMHNAATQCMVQVSVHHTSDDYVARGRLSNGTVMTESCFKILIKI